MLSPIGKNRTDYRYFWYLVVSKRYFSVLRIDIEFSKYRIFFLCFGIPTQDYIAPLLTNSGSVSADYDILEYQLV